jgi:hypothetical protein
MRELARVPPLADLLPHCWTIVPLVRWECDVAAYCRLSRPEGSAWAGVLTGGPRFAGALDAARQLVEPVGRLNGDPVYMTNALAPSVVVEGETLLVGSDMAALQTMRKAWADAGAGPPPEAEAALAPFRHAALAGVAHIADDAELLRLLPPILRSEQGGAPVRVAGGLFAGEVSRTEVVVTYASVESARVGAARLRAWLDDEVKRLTASGRTAEDESHENAEFRLAAGTEVSLRDGDVVIRTELHEVYFAHLLSDALGVYVGRREGFVSDDLAAIGRALAGYADTHQGRYAPKLQALSLDGILDPAALYRESVPDVNKSDNYPVFPGPAFNYLGELAAIVPPEAIVCYPRTQVRWRGAGARAVLARDGQVAWAPAETFYDASADPRVSLWASYGVAKASVGQELTPEEDAALRTFYEVVKTGDP